jgi:RNA polymerase sigma-70 factor (ECF subfamily)
MTAIEFNHQLVTLERKLSWLASSLTSNREDARDLVQETFAKAITYREKFEDHTNMAAWTFTIMKNTFINNYRRTLRAKTTFDNTEDLYYLNLKIIIKSESPDSKYFAIEIQKLIDELGDDFKIPFTMHTQGYKYQEIAEKLNLKIGTVKSRIFFARKKLMPLLA